MLGLDMSCLSVSPPSRRAFFLAPSSPSLVSSFLFSSSSLGESISSTCCGTRSSNKSGKGLVGDSSGKLFRFLRNDLCCCCCCWCWCCVVPPAPVEGVVWEAFLGRGLTPEGGLGGRGDLGPSVDDGDWRGGEAILLFLCCLRRRLERRKGCGDGAFSTVSTSLVFDLRVDTPPSLIRPELRLFCPLVALLVSFAGVSSSPPVSPSVGFCSLMLPR